MNQKRIFIIVVAALFPSIGLSQERTHICQFTAGPLAGAVCDFSSHPNARSAVPVGSPCNDGVYSAGFAVSKAKPDCAACPSNPAGLSQGDSLSKPQPPKVLATGPYRVNRPGFDRGLATSTQCSAGAGMVHASASLDRSARVLSIHVKLETDNLLKGPRGQAFVKLKNAQREVIASAVSDEVQISGKCPGKARSEDFYKHISIDDGIAQAVESIEITTECIGEMGGPCEVVADTIRTINTVIQAQE